MTDTLPCLSVRQPWTWAIFHAGKDIENRGWSTRLRGRVLIHASAGMTRHEHEDFIDLLHDLHDQKIVPLEVTCPPYAALPRGCIVGSVEIADCVDAHTSPWFFGRYGFVLKDPRPFTRPVSYKGRLGFFQVPLTEVPEAA